LIFREKHSAGLGGVLTQALIENQIMQSHDAVCASQGKKDQNVSQLLLMNEKPKQDIPGAKKNKNVNTLHTRSHHSWLLQKKIS
jgi:hypothetical protein